VSVFGSYFVWDGLSGTTNAPYALQSDHQAFDWFLAGCGRFPRDSVLWARYPTPGRVIAAKVCGQIIHFDRDLINAVTT
jgi:hypothetical protein